MGSGQAVEKLKTPVVIKNYFSETKYNSIMNYINSIDRRAWVYEDIHNRFSLGSEYLDRLSMLQLDRAREIFDSKTLLYTYSLLSFYNNKKSKLDPHKDDNACTYTIDVCLYSDEIWPLNIEGVEYNLEKNQAVCFYGEDQLHYRPEFKEGNKVLMLFIHFAEPDHIFFQYPEGNI